MLYIRQELLPIGILLMMHFIVDSFVVCIIFI